MNLLEKRQNLHRQHESISLHNKKLQEQLQSLEGQALLGRAWAMAAHEINNMLVPLSSFAQLAKQNPDDPSLVDKALTKAVDMGHKIQEILRQIPELAGTAKSEKIPCRVQDLIEQVFQAIGRDFSKDRIKITQLIDPDLKITVNPVGIRQVLMNLILNAREAMLTRGGRLTIRTGRFRDQIELVIEDTGCGIEPGKIDKLFEPFFTTKTGTRGTGLGLAICRDIVEKYGGKITAENASYTGSIFTVYLPLISD